MSNINIPGMPGWTIRDAVDQHNSRIEVQPIEGEWLSAKDFLADLTKALNRTRPARMKLHQLKHITDLQVCMAVRMYKHLMDVRRPVDPYPPYPYETLARELETPEKLAYRAMERAYDNGYLSYGVSLRTGWLTDKGIQLLKDNNLWDVSA